MTAIRRLLIANRGEIAVRIARTCREMGIATVAVFSDADERALHVRACDAAVRIGGAAPSESYLRGDRLVDAAARSGADAVHPGYGFLAEDAAFAQAVLDAGLVWVGPTPEVIGAMGDKLAARELAVAAGVPVLAAATIAEGDDVGAAVASIGMPLLVKAAAGGGGKGMRLVTDAREAVDAVDAAQREAARAFGDGRVYLERLVTDARHVEVQVIGDHHGNLVHLFERECSIQRRHQKVVEESPSPGIDDATRGALTAAAVRLAGSIGYTNAGTVEFVVEPDGAFWFLEVNTRLQVEHPVTELVTGLDLVRLQLLVAQGEPLPFAQGDISSGGHAVEVRLYAEDPTTDFLPATGDVHVYEPAESRGVRFDSGVDTGSEVSPHYDPLLAKVIAHGPTRREAAALLATALEQTVVVGVTTNRGFLAQVLRHAAFLAGATTTGFIDQHFPVPGERQARVSDTARYAALVTATLVAVEQRRRSAGVLRGIPTGWRNHREGRQRVTYLCDGDEVEVAYRLDGARQWAFSVGGEHRDVVLHGVGAEEVDLEIDGVRGSARVWLDAGRGHVLVHGAQVAFEEVPRFPAASTSAVAGATLAPMPGTVVSVHAAVGQAVAEGDLLAVLEAMKMEHRITAPHDGTITAVNVGAGRQVQRGEVLVVLEAAGPAA